MPPLRKLGTGLWADISKSPSARRAAQTFLQGPDVIHVGYGLLQRDCQLLQLEDCSDVVLVLPWCGIACEPDVNPGGSAPLFPLSSRRFTAPSVNHDRDAISIRWEDLLPLGYCRVTARVDGGAANCQERISAVELQSAWGGLKTGASGSTPIIAHRVNVCQGTDTRSKPLVSGRITWTIAVEMGGLQLQPGRVSKSSGPELHMLHVGKSMGRGVGDGRTQQSAQRRHGS